MTGDLVVAMRECPQPIIAAVDGVCAGAGAIIAMAIDFRFGAAAAKTAFLFTRVGWRGADMGACAILPRIIGHGRAADCFTPAAAWCRGRPGLGLLQPHRQGRPCQAQALARSFPPARRAPALMTKRQFDEEWAVTIERVARHGGRSPGTLHADQGFPPRYELSPPSGSRNSG